MKKIIPLFCLLIMLVACTPRAAIVQPVAYPQRGAAPQGYGPPQTTHIELAVWSLVRAADKAIQEVERYGGNVAGYDLVLDGEQPYARLSIAVPVDQYAVLRKSLLDLGALQRETQAGVGPAAYGQEPIAVVTGIELQLAPRISLPTREAMARSEHRTVRTLAAALELLVSLLVFLFDAAIWLVVVLGPFAALWWVGRGLVRRIRRAAPPADET
jgi:hypothetical protein